MAKIYISSTYEDLIDARASVYHTLRQMRHDPRAMEDYLATDERPLDMCLKDVENCDLYVGILAWRYGYVPKLDNPDSKSITELEFRHAVKCGKTCLFFVLHDDAPWPRTKMEKGEGAEKFEALRGEVLENYSPSLFRGLSELPALVAMAVREWERPTPEPIRVLYVEDLKTYVDEYKPVMDKHFGTENVKCVQTAAAALDQLLGPRPPEVLVADLHIPPGPSYNIPAVRKNSPRKAGQYAYGADICAVAFQSGIPVVALSTAPIGHPVREPIEESRRELGGRVYHFYKQHTPDPQHLGSEILLARRALDEPRALADKLQSWIDTWSNTTSVQERLAVLNEMQMALEDASSPARTEMRNYPVGQSLARILSDSNWSTEEQPLVHRIRELLA